MTEQHESSSLPENWVWTIIRELSYIVTKGSTPTSYGFSYVQEGISFVKVENIKNGRILKESIREFIAQDAYDFLERSQLAENDVLFSIAGTIGRVGIVHQEDLPANTNQAIALVRCPWQFINPNYLKMFLESPKMQSMIRKRPRGVGMNNVSLEDVKNVEVSLAPFNEQCRIVSRVEELFSCLDAGVESLLKVKTLLKRYRQAVLKYAFEGKLTEEWRKTHKDQTEPAQKLLERIKQEHAENKKGKRKELPPLGVFDLSELPDGWVWTRVDWLCDVQTGPFGTQLHRSDYTDSGVPTIEIGDVHPRRNLKEGTAHFIPKEKALELKRFEVRNGDVLFSRVGTVGRCTIVPPDCNGWIMSTSLIRVRAISSDLLPSYLLFYFWSPIAQTFTRKTSKGTTRAGTNSKIVGELPLIVSPLIEQRVIVEKIEQQLSIADKIEESVEQNLRRTESLRQSILKKAFEGKLVPQDPTDEPAEKLLARIKEEKTRHETIGENSMNERGLMRYVK